MTSGSTIREPLDLDAIEARVNAATPGPWRASGAHVDVWENAVSEEADALFVAHAREDVPALIAEVRHLRARVAELEATLGAAWAVVGEGYSECLPRAITALVEHKVAEVARAYTADLAGKAGT